MFVDQGFWIYLTQYEWLPSSTFVSLSQLIASKQELTDLEELNALNVFPISSIRKANVFKIAGLVLTQLQGIQAPQHQSFKAGSAENALEIVTTAPTEFVIQVDAELDIV